MALDELYKDKDLILKWQFHNQDLIVTHGWLQLYNSTTGFVHEALSERQGKWITEHYEKQRNVYVF